ncbi:uncharacterized protein LOC118752423 [Rhagoletis pomonella]|uniref:uncharacterized protein LOC118752423 n=1 Tax=Rhagoletis pomonella TaxID=28610 RepID=UPI001780A7A1|nr:uncharacterized protein LOC118752423 [Rhagoletis pomonella]
MDGAARAEPAGAVTMPTTEASLPREDAGKAVKPASFRDALCEVKLGIVPENYPATVWSTDELRAIQNAILRAIRGNKDSAIKPIFDGCTFRPGWLSIICRDAVTAEWIRATVPKIAPWKGAKMKVVADRETPRPIILVGFFPELDSSRNEDALLLLQGQNEGLKIMDWRVLNRLHKSPLW